jgi:hypothetical protein
MFTGYLSENKVYSRVSAHTILLAGPAEGTYGDGQVLGRLEV